MISHLDYFLKARKSYDQEISPDISLVNVCGIFTGIEYTDKYRESVDKLSDKISKIFDSDVSSGLVKQFRGDIFKYPEIGYISNEILPQLENKLFGCNVFVDKSYIWRTLFFNKDKKRKWEWFFENEPPTVWKLLINLSTNDVNVFDYLETEANTGQIMESSHKSEKKWIGPKFGHNIPEKYINFYIYDHKCTIKTLKLKYGDVIIFNNNLIRRYKESVIDNHVDLLEIRIRPTMSAVDNYFDRKYTTSYGTSPEINKNPDIK